MKKLTKISVVLLMCVIVICTFAACDFLFGNNNSGNNSSNGGSTGGSNDVPEPVQPKSVTVTLDPNGGSGVSKLVLNGYPGEPMSLPTPTKEGYTFDKWYLGYNTVINNNYFPNNSVTLTARYYANEDTERSIVFQTQPEKQFELPANFTVAHGMYNFSKESLASADDAGLVDYIQNNRDVDILIEASVEILSRRTVKLSLLGSNSADVIVSQRFDCPSYTNVSMSSSGKSRLLYKTEDSADVVIRLVLDSTLGSTYIYFRNAIIKISWTEKAGMLV